MAATPPMFEAFVQALCKEISKTAEKRCEGCRVMHPSQRRHPCMMMSFEEKVDLYFDYALCTMKSKSIVRRYKQELRDAVLSD
jgi:hypothetical protein